MKHYQVVYYNSQRSVFELSLDLPSDYIELVRWIDRKFKKGIEHSARVFRAQFDLDPGENLNYPFLEWDPNNGLVNLAVEEGQTARVHHDESDVHFEFDHVTSQNAAFALTNILCDYLNRLQERK